MGKKICLRRDCASCSYWPLSTCRSKRGCIVRTKSAFLAPHGYWSHIMKSRLALGALLVLAFGEVARAQLPPLQIAIDEFGHGIGTLGPGFLSNDPGPGGLNNVLTYNLPFL